MADFEEVVNTRRSIREYDSKEVEDEKIVEVKETEDKKEEKEEEGDK